MKQHLKQFVRKYLKALNDDNAAVFAGAGLSVPAGYVNWKQLLAEVAEDLHLDIDKEDDLIAVAQYYVNEKQGGRGTINQKLVDEFTRDATVTTNLQLLAQLPIKFYWTTNYDKMIERALDESNKSIDCKIAAENLAISRPKHDAIVYKMHGDISLPHDAVLTKDDYESYNTKRQLFTTALQGDLVSKTFMFIGFSFDDPNLEYILSRIRVLLGENTRDHYCFFKQPQTTDRVYASLSPEEAEEECRYDRLRLEYKIKDLKRYSINALIIDDYTEITEVLEVLNNKIRRKNLFISGAAHEYGEWGEKNANDFVFKLAKELVEKNYKLITGFGLGIGSSVINGALSHVFSTKYRHMEEVIMMRPFPQIVNEGVNLQEVWTNYRKEMTSEAGIAIFAFGNKLTPDGVVDSNGMLEEFEIATGNGIIPIPIGSTGYMAEKLWQRVDQNLDNYGFTTPDLQQAFKTLNNRSLSQRDLLNNIIKIVNLLQ